LARTNPQEKFLTGLKLEMEKVHSNRMGIQRVPLRFE
jgi:hypothetical protein